MPVLIVLIIAIAAVLICYMNIKHQQEKENKSNIEFRMHEMEMLKSTIGNLIDTLDNVAKKDLSKLDPHELEILQSLLSEDSKKAKDINASIILNNTDKI